MHLHLKKIIILYYFKSEPFSVRFLTYLVTAFRYLCTVLNCTSCLPTCSRFIAEITFQRINGSYEKRRVLLTRLPVCTVPSHTENILELSLTCIRAWERTTEAGTTSFCFGWLPYVRAFLCCDACLLASCMHACTYNDQGDNIIPLFCAWWWWLNLEIVQ